MSLSCPLWSASSSLVSLLKSLIPTFISEINTGNAVCAESSSLCREPKLKLTAQGRFAESTRSSSRHRKNTRYRQSAPRGNRAGSRHSHELMAQRHYGESCRSRPSAQPRPHGTTERPSRPLAWPSNVLRAHLLALSKEFCVECFFKALGKELKKFQIHTSKPFAS
jgi:hypothetical protein